MEQRIRNPLLENGTERTSKDLRNDQEVAYKPAYKEDSKTASKHACDPPADLTELTTVWADLPEHIRAAIKALIQVHRK